MDKFTVNARVKSGNLIYGPYLRNHIWSQLLVLGDCDVEITFEKVFPRRSSRQRRFYFGPFVESQIACFKERHGKILSKDQQHSFNKNNFFCEEIFSEKTGEVYRIPRSTNSYGTKEFEEILERIRQTYFEAFDWSLPYPEESPET